MRRLVATIAVIAAVTAAALATPRVVEAADAPTDTVVLVLAPYLRWQDLTQDVTPTLLELAEDGALGNVNSRARERRGGQPGSPDEGALTIASGVWAIPNTEAGAAYNTDEPYEVGTAAEAYQRITGRTVGSSQIVFLGLPSTEKANRGEGYEAVPGVLGSAITSAGGVTAAVGNSDVGYSARERRRVRPAAIAAMTREGLVGLGDVSDDLLRENPTAPFGIETNVESVDQALAAVAARSAEETGPLLVVVDAGDAYRAVKFEPQVTDEVADQHREHALRALDEVVDRAVSRFPGSRIIVASQSTADGRTDGPEAFGPVIANGPGYDAGTVLTSDSTQRDGLVTNMDLTAAVLDSLGIERPVEVLGNPVRAVSFTSGADRAGHLARMSATAVAVDAAKGPVVNTFVSFTVLVLVLSALVLVSGRHWQPRSTRIWVTSLKATLLLLLCVPLSSWLMFVVNRWPRTGAEATLTFLACLLVTWLGGSLLWARSGLRVPIAVVSLATVVVAVVDQIVGAPLSFTNFFGYSPIVAARFYGMGNEAAAVIVGAALVGLALLFDEWPDERVIGAVKRFGIPVVGVTVVVASAAPMFGANVGVAVWGVLAFGLAWVLMNGHHVSWKLVLWLALAVVVSIGLFAAIDLATGSTTHLARALGSAEQGGVSELWTIVARKAATNMRVLTATNWAYILLAVLGFLGFMRWRPQGDFATTLKANPHFADAITVSLVAGLAAYFTEDSGIVIPALEVFYVGVAIAWLMLDGLVRGTDSVVLHEEESSR